MGCCLNVQPLPPEGQRDFASQFERDLGLYSVTLQGFLALVPPAPNFLSLEILKAIYKSGRWATALEGPSMSLYVLQHPDIHPEAPLIHRHALIALALLYANASESQRRKQLVSQSETMDTLGSIVQKMLTIAGRVVPLYLEEKSFPADRIASHHDITRVLAQIVQGIGSLNNPSHTKDFLATHGQFLFRPETIRKALDDTPPPELPITNMLVGTRERQDSDEKEEEEQLSENEHKSKPHSHSHSHRSEKEEVQSIKSEKKSESGGEEEEEKGTPEELLDIEQATFELDITALKFEKIPRTKCAFNAYIDHLYNLETCCDITHTIGFNYLEKMVRLAKYAWKAEGGRFWRPLWTILAKHIELISAEENEVERDERMQNLLKFIERHYEKGEMEALEEKAKEESSYHGYVEFLEKKMKKTREFQEIDELALLTLKALNNYKGNLRSACSEVNRNVIRKHVDLPLEEEGVIGDEAFVDYFMDCCKSLRDLIPSAKTYIR